MNMQHKQELIERLQACTWRASDMAPQGRGAFNMRQEIFECGSPACVAGHCWDLLKGREDWENNCELGDEGIALYLGVSEGVADAIHMGRFSPRRLEHITVDETIQFLEALDDDWDVDDIRDHAVWAAVEAAKARRVS